MSAEPMVDWSFSSKLSRECLQTTPMHLISIIIPAYNAQLTINDCIGSVLRQMKPHHELIVVNDGSTDDTAWLLDALKKSHNVNFKIIDQANQGLSVSRNNGIALATGHYVLLLDADDILLANALDLIDTTIVEKRPDAITFDYNYWYPCKNTRKYAQLGYNGNILISDKEIILNHLFVSKKMYAWLKVFKLDIYKKIGQPPFPPHRFFEDIATVPKLLSCCSTLVYLPNALIDYRQHPDSVTKKHSVQSCLDFSGALLSTKEFIEKQGISTSTKLCFDYFACYLYLSTVKNAYVFPIAIGRELRQQAKSFFLQSLFNDVEIILLAMEQGKPPLCNNIDHKDAQNIRKALANDFIFTLHRTLSAKIKVWRRQYQRSNPNSC